MSASLQIVFLDSKPLESPQGLSRIIQTYVDAGFEIDQFRIENNVISKDEYIQKPEEMIARAYDTKELSFQSFNPKWRFETRQQVVWGFPNMGSEKRAWIRASTDNTPYFWRAEYEPTQYSRFFLDIGKSLYDILKPTFGWADFDYGLFTTHEDIESLQLPALYWANFFSPAYINVLGREKILSAPAWEVEHLADGGLLYLLASCPGLAADHVSIESVKAHYNIEKVR